MTQAQEPAGKPVSLSKAHMTEIVFPPDTNYHGTIFGGKVMQYIDKIAAIAAMRHAGSGVVTASMDSLDFLAPVKLGEAVNLEAKVTWTHRSSMEVHVVVQSENLLTGERKTTSTAFLTFVAMDEHGKPTTVPPVLPETDEEQRLFATARERYDARMKRKADRRKNN